MEIVAARWDESNPQAVIYCNGIQRSKKIRRAARHLRFARSAQGYTGTRTGPRALCCQDSRAPRCCGGACNGVNKAKPKANFARRPEPLYRSWVAKRLARGVRGKCISILRTEPTVFNNVLFVYSGSGEYPPSPSRTVYDPPRIVISP